MNHHRRSAQVWHVFSRDLYGVLSAHPHVHPQSEWAIPAFAFPAIAGTHLVLIYRPVLDGRLSRPWCDVAPAQIRTGSLSIASPSLYHTATSAPVSTCPCSRRDTWVGTVLACVAFCLSSLTLTLIRHRIHVDCTVPHSDTLVVYQLLTVLPAAGDSHFNNKSFLLRLSSLLSVGLLLLCTVESFKY